MPIPELSEGTPTPAPPGAARPKGPRGSSLRLESLDALRGFALFWFPCAAPDPHDDLRVRVGMVAARPPSQAAHILEAVTQPNKKTPGPQIP